MKIDIKRWKRNDFWSKLIKNVTIVLFGNGGASAINLLFTILMTRFLGNAKYGIIVLALQYMNLIDGIVNFQSWGGVIKYGSEAVVEKCTDKLFAIIKAGFVIDIVTAILGTIIALCILPLASKVMVWDRQLMLLAALFSLEILFHIEGTSIGVLRLFDKFKYAATRSIVSALIKFLVMGVYFLTGGRSLLIVTIIYVATDVLKHLMLVFFALKVITETFGIRQILNSSFSVLDNGFFKYTIWNNFRHTADVPVKYFDVFIVSLISVEMVAIYKVFSQILQAISMLVNPISQAILPQFAELIALGRHKEALRKVIKLRNIVLLLGINLVVGSMILGKPVFTILLGKEFGDNNILFVTMLAVQIYLMSYTAIHPFFASLGVAKEDFLITLVSNVIYVIIVYVLVRIIGIYAVVLSLFIQGTISIYGKYYYSKYRYVQKLPSSVD